MHEGTETVDRPRHQWRLVIVVDGARPTPGWARLVAPDALVIAADGGARHATAEGVRVTDVVGDLDSLEPAALTSLVARGARVHRHPVDKDATDFELAAHLAVRLVADRPGPVEGPGATGELLVVGASGGRIDHELGNIAVLGGDALAGFDTTAILGGAVAGVARPGMPVLCRGAAGATVSLVPVGGAALGVTTTGLVFPVHGEDLDPGSSRGISNRVAAPGALVTVSAGVLLVIEPGAFADTLESAIVPDPGVLP